MILTRKLISLFAILLSATVTKSNLWDNLYSNQIANQALTTFLGQSVDTQIQGNQHTHKLHLAILYPNRPHIMSAFSTYVNEYYTFQPHNTPHALPIPLFQLYLSPLLHSILLTYHKYSSPDAIPKF